MFRTFQTFCESSKNMNEINAVQEYNLNMTLWLELSPGICTLLDLFTYFIFFFRQFVGFFVFIGICLLDDMCLCDSKPLFLQFVSHIIHVGCRWLIMAN